MFKQLAVISFPAMVSVGIRSNSHPLCFVENVQEGCHHFWFVKVIRYFSLQLHELNYYLKYSQNYKILY